MKKITPLTGKAAVFVRAFMEHYYSDVPGHDKLYDCGSAGKQAVLDDDEVISDGYISKLSKLLVTEKVVSRYKVGQKYYNGDAEHTEAFREFLQKHDDWGRLVVGTVQDIKDKSEAYRQLDDEGGIRGGGDQLIPRGAFTSMMGHVAQGKLDIIFVRAGAVVGVKHNGKTNRIERYSE
jgi:hypothetical protein